MLTATAAHVFVADIERPVLSEGDTHHVGKVLRVRPGDVVTASDGVGRWRPCRFGGGPELTADGPVGFEHRPVPALTIAFAPVKGERPEWAVQKLTELGVDRIVAFRAARSVVRWDAERAARQLERWRRVAREAAMQSRQAWLPEVILVDDLPAALVAGPGAALAHRGGEAPGLDHPTVLIGPEGGWAPEELDAAPALVGLGPSVLRAETAAVAAAVLLGGLRSGVVSGG